MCDSRSCNQTQDEAHAHFNCTEQVCSLRREYHVLFEPYFQDFTYLQECFYKHQTATNIILLALLSSPRFVS